MSTIELSPEERAVSDWIRQIYGEDVQQECLRILAEPGVPSHMCAEVLEAALYKLNRTDIDNARSLDEQWFCSD